MADAIMARLVHSPHHMELTGESKRKKSKETEILKTKKKYFYLTTFYI